MVNVESCIFNLHRKDRHLVQKLADDKRNLMHYSVGGQLRSLNYLPYVDQTVADVTFASAKMPNVKSFVVWLNTQKILNMKLLVVRINNQKLLQVADQKTMLGVTLDKKGERSMAWGSFSVLGISQMELKFLVSPHFGIDEEIDPR